MALEIKLNRCDNTPWGFRLVGGTDFEYPITVSKVLECSLAEHSGLLDGDVIIDVNERPASRLTHEGAHDVIMQAGNQCVLRVVRADEYRNPMNADPGDYEPVPAITQGFTPITTPLGHEVPDHRTRGCESPFTLASKPYRPFSTEPVIGIPPLEEPIILDPKYRDDFTKIQLKDFEPDTIFKLKKANEKYTNCSSNFSETAQNGYSEVNLAQFSEIVQNGFSENYITDVDVKNIEITTQSLVDENLSKAFQMSGEMKKAINFKEQNNHRENFDINENITNNTFLSKKDIIVEDNLSVIDDIDKISSEIDSGLCKQEQKEFSTNNVDRSIESEIIIEDQISQMTQCIAISQSETSKDSKSVSSQVSQSLSMEQSESNDENSHALKSKNISMAKRLGNNMLMEENNECNISTTNVQCEESKIGDNKKSINHTSISDVSTEQRERETISVSERSEKTVETNEQQACSSKLLKESALLRSQTIPGLQGTIHSSHQYDLLLKTFFIHLTDVMIVLSRLLMSDQSLSRSVSPMPIPKKESVTQKTEKVVKEQNIASGRQSRLTQFQNQSQNVSLNRIATTQNNRNAENRIQVSEKSELDAKIEEILGQRDPLEWLAVLDERSNSGIKSISKSEELNSRNEEGVIMWEGHSHLIFQKERNDSKINESAMRNFTANTTAKEEMKMGKLTENQDSKSLSQKTQVQSDQEILDHMIEASERRIEDAVPIANQTLESKIEEVQIGNEISESKETNAGAIQIVDNFSEINESEIKDMQTCDKISEMKEDKAEAVDISNENSIINESEIKVVQIREEICETEENKVEAVDISIEKLQINKSEIKDVQIREATSEMKENKVEAMDISIEKLQINESEIKAVQIREATSEMKENKVEAMDISIEKLQINESEIEAVQISEATSEMKESKVETYEISNKILGVHESRVEAVKISNAISEVKHESIQISDELSETKETEIRDVLIFNEEIEINKTEVKSGQTYIENVELDEIGNGEAVELAEEFSEVSKADIEERPMIDEGLSDIVQESYCSQNTDAVLEGTLISEKVEQNLDQLTEVVSSVTEIEHENSEATVLEDNQVRKQSAPEIKTETDQYIPAPQTPLTDEYMFRLEIKLVESRSPSKSPARVTKKPPKPKPQTQHEDPHIVKKPKLKASIETEIETLNSFTNKTDHPSIESTQCTKYNLSTEPPSTPKTPLSTADASSMATNSTTKAVLCLEEIASCPSKTDSNIDNAVSTCLSTVAASNTATNSNPNNAFTTETGLGDFTNLSSGAQKAQIAEGVQKKINTTANISSDTTSNTTNTLSTPTDSATETTLSTTIPLTLESISTINTTALNTEAISITATNLSTQTALSTFTNSSTYIASSTASTCTSQQHENAQIAEDIGIVEQQLPGKESRKPSLPAGILANDNIESSVNEKQNGPEVEENCQEVQKSIECEDNNKDNTHYVEMKDENGMDNKKEIAIVDQKVPQNGNEEDDIGKPGLSDEQIATLMSGESEVLKGQHIIGLSKVLASHMSRELDEDDDSSINFKKMKPQIEALKDSEVLKILNDELLKTKEEKKREERKYTTFLQRPNRPIPLSGNLWYNQPPPEKYKVKIVKQPKPRVAPDAPKNFETGLLPWEQRKLNEPPPPPIEREDPILVPEEGPEYLEALDNLPESAVPDLEDTGLPLPPEPVPKEEDCTEKTEDLDFNTEGDTGDELDDFSEAQTEEEKVEMEQSKMAMNVLCNIEDTVDPNMSVEEQLAVMHSQLLALSQLPAAIQHTLEAVTQQLSRIVPRASDNTKVEEQPASENEQIHADIDQEKTGLGENTECKSHPIEECDPPSEAINDDVAVATPEQEVDGRVMEEVEKTNPEKSEIIIKEQEVGSDQKRTIDQSKRELIAELELEHQQRQVKQRPTSRVGRPKPAFGPLVPQERPMILPGGRKWRRPKDAYNDDFIAETLTAQAEILQGKAKGLPYESVRLPYDQRINFMKYEKPEKSLDYLKDSGVYKLVHETDVPARGLEVRPAMVLAESEFRERCRSVTPVNTERVPPVQEEHLDIPQQLQP